MTEQERINRNELCTRLMSEGIDPRQEVDAVARTDTLVTLAIELGRNDSLACALSWLDNLEQSGVHDESAIILDYCRANAIAQNRYGTKWQWEQPTLSREIYYLRRAISHTKFRRIVETTRCMILNNLGNRLRVAGRIVEALEYWRRALEVLPMFGMALCNRALAFAQYADAIEDTGKRALFLWMAHNEASVALASTSIYTDPHDAQTMETVKELKEDIEVAVDVKGISACNPLSWPDTSTTKEEHDYQNWCLRNCLYLDPLNDLGWHAVAISDSLGLAGHVVRIDAPHRFESFFDQMKQEYVSARWLLYEGLNMKTPHFSDKDVFLHVTEPRPVLSLTIEKVKTAYRIAYSLFDKVSFFVNAFMELGIPEKHVSFRKLWRPNKEKPIRIEFDQTINWAFCALYWLAKDLFEKENDEVSEPQARGLSDIRNYLEHKYLRITADKPTTAPPDDVALMVSREQFESKALHILKLARSALIYLTIGVRFEEDRRQPDRTGEQIGEIPLTPHLPDAEKI